MVALVDTATSTVSTSTTVTSVWRDARRHRPTPRPSWSGDEVVSVSVAGRVSRLDLGDGALTDAWELPRPSPASEPNVVLHRPWSTTALVVTSTPVSGPADVVSYAYPVRPGPRPDVLLDLTPIPVPSPPTEPVTVLDDGSLLVSGFDGVCGGSTPVTAPRSCLTNEDRIATTGVVADGLVVVRRDDQLLAMPLEGGDPRWSIQAGNAYAGSTPAVAAGTVFAGTSDGRLLAVALDDGKVRWSAPVDENVLPKPPLVLSSGDVVYGVGLTRYDASTGAPVWADPGTNVYGAPVETGGLVVGAAFLSDGTAGLGGLGRRHRRAGLVRARRRRRLRRADGRRRHGRLGRRGGDRARGRRTHGLRGVGARPPPAAGRRAGRARRAGSMSPRSADPRTRPSATAG